MRGHGTAESHLGLRATGEARVALKNIGTLFGVGTMIGSTDGQLLERFAESDRESSESAFAAMVERHGSMVFRACRIEGDVLTISFRAVAGPRPTEFVANEHNGTLDVYRRDKP